MVPPLVMVNAKYYGWRIALYIAAILFASIVLTALIMHFSFGLLGLTPESRRTLSNAAQFAIDYTFFMNLAFALVAAILVGLHRGWVQHEMKEAAHQHHEHGSRLSIKRMIALTSAVVIGGGLIAFALTGGVG